MFKLLRFLVKRNNPGTDAEQDGRFDFVTGGFDELQLDIVGFLAILGEGSVLANAQVSALSKWIFVPRLLPAPQAFLRPNRPQKLEWSPGHVTGVYSGNKTDRVNHIGNVVIDAENMPDFAVRCVEITRDPSKPDVKAKTKAPLTAVAALGCIMSIILLALAIYYKDLPALLADLSLSLLSTIIGFGNKWTLELPRRTANTQVPDGDVVIRYPKGSFLVVKCQENVARELYFAPENINYMISHPPVYRLISLVGTIMLMFGVIALGNAANRLQLAFAGSYMILNAAYWVVAALPAKMHWDTSAFSIKNHRFDYHYDPEADRVEAVPRNKKEIVRHATFTQALWKVIIATKSVDWVRRGEAAPETEVWERWLDKAFEMANQDKDPVYEDKDGMTVWRVPKWDPQGYLKELMEASKTNKSSNTTRHKTSRDNGIIRTTTKERPEQYV